MKKLLVTLLIGVVVIGLIMVVRGNMSPEDAKRDLAADLPAQQQEAEQQSGSAGADEKYKLLEGTELLPVDEASENADFLKFRYELMEAIKEKNVAFIKEHVDETIRYSFGENDGLAGFLEAWNLTDTPEKSDFWMELFEVVNLGGTFDAAGSFVAPYVYSKFPDSLDAFQNSAVVEERIKLYSQPNTESEVVGLLNYNIVQISAWEQGSIWQKVQVSKGIAGYVQSEYLRSPIDYRAMFASKAGTWKMVFFVAGD